MWGLGEKNEPSAPEQRHSSTTTEATVTPPVGLWRSAVPLPGGRGAVAHCAKNGRPIAQTRDTRASYILCSGMDYTEG